MASGLLGQLANHQPVIGAESQIPTYEPATNILEELRESFLAIFWPLNP